MPTREQLVSALKNADASGDAVTAKKIANALKYGQYSDAQRSEVATPAQQEPQEDISIPGALGSGFIRGVEQVIGGGAQKLAQSRLSQLNKKIDDFVQGMYDGSIPYNNESLSTLDRYQQEAVDLSKTLQDVEDIEKSKRQEFSEIQEQRPISALAGNVAGQIAAFPLPGSQARLPFQMARGAAEGGAIGYVQPTVGDEQATDAATSGAVIGGAVPAVLRPITSGIGAAYRAIKGRLSPDQEMAAEFATRENVPLTTTDFVPPETFAGRSAQGLGEKIPFAGTGGIRAEQQKARERVVRELSERYGTASDQEIFNSLVNKSSRLSNAAGKRYQQITSSMSGIDIPVVNTVSTIDAQLARLNRPGSIKNPKLTAILQRVKDDITSGAQDINLLRDNRTRFREEIKGESFATNTTEDRIIQSVYKAMTDDMTNATRANLGDKAAASLRQADAIWAREADEVKKTMLKTILETGNVKPDKVRGMLFSNSPGEINKLYTALDSTGRRNARAAVISRAFDQSGGSPDRFINEMKKVRDQNEIFFRGQDGRDLNGLIKYLEFTKQAGRAPVQTPTGQQTLQIGAPVAVITDFNTTGGLGTATFAGFGGLARAYESQPVRNILARMASVEKGSTQFEKLASQLESKINMAATRAQEAQ